MSPRKSRATHKTMPSLEQEKEILSLWKNGRSIIEIVARLQKQFPPIVIKKIVTGKAKVGGRVFTRAAQEQHEAEHLTPEILARAQELGYVLTYTVTDREKTNLPKLHRREVCIWHTRKGWTAADGSGQKKCVLYSNHRRYETLSDALDGEEQNADNSLHGTGQARAVL